MRVRIAAVGRRMPGWAAEGYEEFRRRLPPEIGLELVEIAPSRARKSGDTARALREEGSALGAAVAGFRTVALDERGRAVSSAEIAERLRDWRDDGVDVGFLIGGADGLDPALKHGATHTWALSRLTLPHMLVRVLLAEQLFRAWSMLSGHPYHRG